MGREKSYKDYDLDFELNYDKGDVNFFLGKKTCIQTVV